jgi:hypothetical protein
VLPPSLQLHPQRDAGIAVTKANVTAAMQFMRLVARITPSPAAAPPMSLCFGHLHYLRDALPDTEGAGSLLEACAALHWVH